MAEPLRLLVVGAHPADIFDQSAGTMAHHVQRGDWVGCVVLTHGARIHDKVISEEMFGRAVIPEADELREMMAQRSDVKAQETLAACRLIGLKDHDVLFFAPTTRCCVRAMTTSAASHACFASSSQT